MTGEKMQELLGNPLEVYLEYTSGCLGRPKDFYVTLYLSVYAGL